jgi:hypothetical protein
MTEHAPVSPIARTVNTIASRVGAAPLALLVAALTPLPVQGGKSLLGLPSICVFHNVTGLPCPGCGMTRSVVCCCHLRFAESIRYHPLGFIVFGWLLIAALRRLPFPHSWRKHFPTIPSSLRAVTGVTLVVLMFAIWGMRLASWLPSPP